MPVMLIQKSNINICLKKKKQSLRFRVLVTYVLQLFTFAFLYWNLDLWMTSNLWILQKKFCSCLQNLLKWSIVFVEWLIDEKSLTLFLAATIVRYSHHHQSQTRCQQELRVNLHRITVQALLKEVVHQW